MDIYVGNLPYTANEEDIRGIFEAFGDIQAVKIINDRETGRSKGFGFVTLADQSRVDEAVKSLNGSNYQGRPLKINPSEPRASGSGGFGGGGYSSGFRSSPGGNRSGGYKGGGRDKRSGGW